MNHTLDADGNLVSINDIPLTPRSVPLMSQARWGTEPLSIPMGYASQDPQPMSSNDREILQDEELGYSSENEEDEEGAGSFRTASSGSPSKDESTFSHHVEGSSSSDTSAHVESPSSAMSDPEFSGGDTELEDDVVSPLPSSHVRKVGKAVYDRSPRTYEYARSYRPSASTSVRPPSISSLSISEPYPHIAHSKRVVELFDELRVPWGVQFRIACLVCDGQITWDQVTREILQSLTGTNMDAGPKMRTVFRPLLKGLGGRVMGTTPDADIALFRELDLEDEALEEGSNRNLGLNGEDDEAMGTWWAGHVEQRGILEEYRPPGGTRRLRIRLVHQRYHATSNRFLRKLGSRRFLKVSMKFEAKTTKDEADLEEFLLKGHVINGRVFRVFCGQDIDSPIYLIETDENIDRRAVEEMGDSQRVSLTQFLAWHNPWAWNKTQRMSKWTARFALGLSTSEPAGIFKAQNIHVIRDIESPYRDHTRPIQNKEIMTDGCGLINAAALRMIQKNQRLESVPCAVQGRVAGAKGLWLLDINDQSEEPTIWLTDSQVKIKYENLDRLINDPALRIFDLLRISQTKYPANIGAQPIINLSHNGVPTEVFSTMLQEALRDKVDTLLNFWRRGTEQDLALLWDRIFGLGGLSRLKRARVGGNSEGPQDFGIASHMRKKAKEKAATKEDDEDEGKKDIDEWSGCPSDLYEVAFEMIQAGFHPRNSTYLGVKIRQILKQELERMLSKLRIPVRYSAEVFAVPDFWGVLEEGEVYFRSSKDIEFPDPTKIGSVVEGPVVIFRYPVRLPTDAQKFTAVNHRALHHLKDVVVFSTKGRRSGPSILAGGDCDGDMMVVIWDPRIVDPFENSDVDKFADPPSDFKEKFLTDGGEKVDKFLERLKQEFPTQGPGELDYVRGPLAETQKYLLGGCKKRSNVGQYSIWADTIGYINGLEHDKALEFAHKFCVQLDAQKSGIHVRDEVYNADRVHARTLKSPPYVKKFDLKDVYGSHNQGFEFNSSSQDSDGFRGACARRDPSLPPFVLDELEPLAKEQSSNYQNQIDSLASDDGEGDPDLLRPLLNAEGAAARFRDEEKDTRMTEELQKLRQFVKDKKREWGRIFLEGGNLSRTSSQSSSSSMTSMRPLDQVGVRQKAPQWYIDREKALLSKSFNQDFPFDSLRFFREDEAKDIMCSFAYQYSLTSHSKSLQFAFSVGFQRLMAIKAAAIGGHGGMVTMKRTFSDLSVPKKGLRKDLEVLTKDGMQIDEEDGM